MQNSIFHNNKIFKKTLEKKKLSYLQNTNIKVNVDINKLLNRVKIEQNIEKKNKITFFSLGILLMGLMGIFVSIIR
jgi:hypothetical protein